MSESGKKNASAAMPGKKKRKKLRRVILILLIVLVLGGAGWILIRQLQNQYTVVYQSYNTGRGSISNSLSFSGTMQAISNVSFTSSSATTVRSVYVKEGDQVFKGDKLVRLTSGQVIESEFDGTVNQLYFHEGDKVVAGDILIQVVDFQHMKVSIRVDEYDISDVHVGTQCRVTTTATNETFPCTIDSINYVSSSTGNVAYYTATAYVDVTGTVYPGMQVTVTVPQEEASDVVILKADAISFSANNQAFVYMPDASGQMQRVPIGTGVTNGNYVEITSGLNDGDTVYAVAKQEEESGLSGLLSGLFGSQTVRNSNPGGSRQNWNGSGGNGGSGGQNRPGSSGGGTVR